MRRSPFILRSAALLLLIVFSQKSGAGLFLHNLLHAPGAMAGFPENKNEKGRDISYACTCLDDFLMPFNGAEETICPQPVLNHVLPVVLFNEPVSYRAPVYSFLRGPPQNS